tara:strand:+ start:8638 stop:12456 length:3819 start_codon:yes stop_codon:yes gene_type:complete
MASPQHPSPENIDEFRSVVEQLGPVPSGDTIDSLLEDHPKLSRCLHGFDQLAAVRLIASLETFPDLLENSLRIEVLLHLAVYCCTGTKKPSRSDLETWVSLVNSSPWKSQEDPAEDVFVGYICTVLGGFRVYLGTFSNADFILERLLVFLAEKRNFPPFNETFEAVIELLRIAEAIADSLGQKRYCVGQSSVRESIVVPHAELLSQHSDALSFSPERMESLGIDRSKLEPFVLKQEKPSDLANAPFIGSHLERYPLVAKDGGLVVAFPSSLCRAAISSILQVTPHLGGLADAFLGKENAEFFANEVLLRLKIRPADSIALPKSPEGLPPLFPYVGQFDYGMPVLAFIKSTNLSDSQNLEEIESFTKEQEVSFNEFLSDCCEACERMDGFKGGLLLIALGGVGRPVLIGLGEKRDKWHLFSASLADWSMLSYDDDFNARRLWYLGLQQEEASNFNLQFTNTSGLLNLYGYWRSRDFSLVDESIDPRNPRNHVWIDGTFSSHINTELRSTYDRHCRWLPDQSESVILQRRGPGLDPDLRSNLLYGDHAAASKGLLRGCVADRNSAWWVTSAERPSSPEKRNLAYRIWDCVFNWAELAMPRTETALGRRASNEMEIFVEFADLENWDMEDLHRAESGQSEISLRVEKINSRAVLSFGQEFMGKFYRADNLAEREIVRNLVVASLEINASSVCESDVEKIVQSIVRGSDTRFFHLVNASTLETVLGGPGNAEPTFVPAEEISRAKFGLAFRVEKEGPRQISESKEARLFLDRIVANIQRSVCARLRQVSLLSVISESFSQIDELYRDKSRWDLSTRSLLALANDAPWIHERLRSERSKLSLAELTNRILIETAAYSHAPDATEVLSKTEHASLLSQMALMLELANHRDAIVGGFIEANLQIHSNGVIEFNESFQEEIFQPYLVARIDDLIASSADSYDLNFTTPSRGARGAGEVDSNVTAFMRAFEAEYEFSFEKINDLVDFFDDLAVRNGQAGGAMLFSEFKAILRAKIGMNRSEVDTFLDRFTLPIRSAWDKDLPLGCEKSDVLPWRFSRGLSVLLRPIPVVSKSPEVVAISAPHLHRWRQYLTYSILEGRLPDRLFSSAGMKKYLGQVANKKGHEFTEETAANIKKVLPSQRIEIKLTELGAPQQPDLGDVDILSWDQSAGLVFLIECKRLKPALTVRHVIQQLEEFRGDKKEKDSLAKHQMRVDWLRENPVEIERITGINRNDIKWIPLLVTSGRVPMAFVDAIDFSKDQVVPASDLCEFIQSQLDSVKSDG